MSLEEFVEHPIARELLHDGQAYQVTLGGAAEVAGGGGKGGTAGQGEQWQCARCQVYAADRWPGLPGA